jgi:hypothetical protein
MVQPCSVRLALPLTLAARSAEGSRASTQARLEFS